jgi:elongation factor Ts
VAYNHGGYRVAVLIGMNQSLSAEIETAGKDAAMQAAAMNPVAIDEASVPANIIDRERNVIIETMKQDPKMVGKSEEMIAKIAEGKLNAFFKENTLLAQQFVKDNSKTVAEYITSVNKDLKIVAMERENVGS